MLFIFALFLILIVVHDFIIGIHNVVVMGRLLARVRSGCTLRAGLLARRLLISLAEHFIGN